MTASCVRIFHKGLLNASPFFNSNLPSLGGRRHGKVGLVRGWRKACQCIMRPLFVGGIPLHELDGQSLIFFEDSEVWELQLSQFLYDL